MLHAKKSSFGWKTYAEEQENTDSVILTYTEYYNLLGKISELKEKLYQEQQLRQQEKNRLQVQLNSWVAQLKTEKDGAVKAAQEELSVAKEKADFEAEKNAYLVKRIKAKANADRNLYPKNQRSGYILQQMDEYTVSFRLRSKVVKKECWKVKMQTPFEAQLPPNIVRDSVQTDLLSDFGRSLGICCTYEEKLSFTTEIEVNQVWNTQENFVFNLVYKLNAVRGYWEVEFLSNTPLTITPDILP